MLIYFIALILISSYLFYTKEKFTMNNNFELYNNTVFRGINMFGIASDEGTILVSNINECQDICDRNKDCKGFTYFYPTQKCYIYSSGNVIPSDQGFQAGKKIL